MKSNLFLKYQKSLLAIFFSTLLFAFISSCYTYNFRSDYQNANALMHGTQNLQTKPFLKAHLKNGDVAIINNSWQVDTVNNTVSGNGINYDFNRNKKSEGFISINIDSVAIFETNEKIINSEAGRITTLSILAGLDAALGIYCLSNPKACFGSCPTFYLNKNDNFHFADAEGFSNAIAPSMEYFDIDALNNKKITAHTFSITMKNEALETHCVNEVKLIAFPRKENERIYHSSPDNFYLCENNYLLTAANADEGDVTSLLKLQDRKERFSLSDEKNLKSREEIVAEFEVNENAGRLGLKIDFRQTLMTTYFIYSAIGFMGDEVGDMFAEIEKSAATKNSLEGGIKKELGDIDIYTWDVRSSKWIYNGKVYETGPIANNHQFVPLNIEGNTRKVKIKLVLNKGLWRIDYLGLASIKQKVKPVVISPASVLNKGKIDDAALQQLIDSNNYLVSMPGSEYQINFKLPEQANDYELFLYSKGYYLEWMRAHWIKDKDLLKLKQMVDDPRIYLLDEASQYKRYENAMEQEFWNSKIDTKSFSYYAN